MPRNAGGAADDARLFMIPDSPYISWASMMIAALIVLDVSTQVGEYHSAVRSSAKWGKDAPALRQVRRSINVAALQVVVVGMVLVAASARLVTHLTEGIDRRMVLVLEGVSRLEASHLVRSYYYEYQDLRKFDEPACKQFHSDDIGSVS